MSKEIYRYDFSHKVPLEDVEASLLLAIFGTESLHGESQVRLDASHFVDTQKKSCVIDSSTPVGRDINRLFVGFLRREFEECDFSVERVTDRKHPDLIAA